MELESHLNLHGVKMASFSYDCISEYRQYSISRAPLKARMNDYLICNISNMRDSVSSGYPNTKKRVEASRKCDAQRSIFDEIRDVWKADETLS